MSTKVFFVGITGYIGGSVFTTIKNAHPEYTYNALSRNPSTFPAIVAAGATPIEGTFSDREIIVRQASESDIVVSCAGAHAHDITYAEALVEGLKKKKAEGRGMGVVIQISGSAIFRDDAKDGKFVEGGKIWNDSVADDVKNMPIKAHGLLFDAAEAGDINAYFVSPGATYGVGTGPVKTAPTFIGHLSGLFLSNNRAFYVGEGSSVFDFNHISDVTSLYLAVFDYVLSGKDKTTSPYEHYYFSTTESLDWKTIATLIGADLHKNGKLPSAIPVSVSFEEAGMLAAYGAANVLTKAERGKTIGWVPSNKQFKDFFAGAA